MLVQLGFIHNWVLMGASNGWMDGWMDDVLDGVLVGAGSL
jgi:hypothetical protein